MSSPKALPEEGIWNPAVNTNSLGWFARDPKTLAMVGEVALGGAGKPKDKLKKVMIAEDLFKMCHEKAVATGALEIVKRAAVALVGKDNVLQVSMREALGTMGTSKASRVG